MRRQLIATVMVAALAAGCAASGAPQTRATVSETLRGSATVGATVGATPSPTPSASAEAPPEVDLTAEDGDYRRVVEEILRFREWLFANPHRQDLVSVIYNEDCRCHAGLQERMQAYVDAGRRVEATTSLISFEVLDEDSVSFRARVTWEAEGRVLEGETVVDRGAGQAMDEQWFLLKDASGSYRVAGQSSG